MSKLIGKVENKSTFLKKNKGYLGSVQPVDYKPVQENIDYNKCPQKDICNC